MKLQSNAFNFIKKETLAQLFSCEFCKIFKNILFYKTPLVATSVSSRIQKQSLVGYKIGILKNFAKFMGKNL